MKNVVEKKVYQSPKMDVVEMRSSSSLLSLSDPSEDALDQDVIEIEIED